MTDAMMIQRVLDLFSAKELDALLALFADDAIVYDPHYPQPRMVGKAAIRRGFAWGMASLEKPGFTVRNSWAEGNKLVVELDTHHVIRGNMKAEFDQVFVADVRDGLITRLQSYVPYRPGGIAAVLSRGTALAWRVRGIRD